MTTTSHTEAIPRPLELNRVLTFASVAVALFLAAWGVLHLGWYSELTFDDRVVYIHYGKKMERGEVTYRDFDVEYPPLALPTFALPALGGDDSFNAIFEGLMAACGAAAVCFGALALRSLGATDRRLALAAAFAALAPLALGSIILARFDLWPAGLSVAALAALLANRYRLAAGVLGLAVAAKLYPGVLLPLALAYAWRRAGRREALVSLGVFSAVLFACFLPFLVVSPGGVVSSISGQLSRPLQIESLGSSVLLAAHHVFGLDVSMETSHGSQNLVGPGTVVAALALSAAQIATIVGIWVWFARGPATPERLVRAAAAVLVAFIALGKVLSPQFLIWLIPVVPLVRGLRGVAASAVLLLALVVTQLWFPFRYLNLVYLLDETPSFLVLLRDLALVALLAVLLWPEQQRTRSATG